MDLRKGADLGGALNEEENEVADAAAVVTRIPRWLNPVAGGPAQTEHKQFNSKF